MINLFFSLLCIIFSNRLCSFQSNDTAVIVLAYNRPHYFEQCLKALEKNPETEYMPVIFALDGGPKATQKENKKLIEQSTLKNKKILLREYNYGCAKNYIDAHRYAFDQCSFKKIILIEDDVLVTDSYICSMLNLHAWAQRNYTNIGVVQGWSFCFLSPEKKLKFLDQVIENDQYWSFVTYLMDKKTWDSIKPIIYTYEKYIDTISLKNSQARSRPEMASSSKEITSWVHHLVKHKKEVYSQGALPSRYAKKHKAAILSKQFAPNIDHMLGFALYMNSIIKIKMVVNRAIHIGQEGISTDPSLFAQWRYAHMKLDTFEQDKTLKKFNYVS
jgi:glycosyltransferase involved in cell wall biosynthesis